jgi:hypothetical protein
MNGGSVKWLPDAGWLAEDFILRHPVLSGIVHKVVSTGSGSAGTSNRVIRPDQTHEKDSITSPSFQEARFQGS